MRRTILVVVVLMLAAATTPALAGEQQTNRALAETYAKPGAPLEVPYGTFDFDFHAHP